MGGMFRTLRGLAEHLAWAAVGAVARVAGLVFGLHSGRMSRNSGVGWTSFGIVLVVVGAILRLATSVHSSGFNVHKVGDVLLLAGILVIILGLIIVRMGAARTRGRTRT